MRLLAATPLLAACGATTAAPTAAVVDAAADVADAAADVADAAADVADADVPCPSYEPATPTGCPSCLAGRWRVYGNAGTLSGPFPLEISGCGAGLTCVVAGSTRRCFWAGTDVRVYLDGVGYLQLVFHAPACTRMTGSYLTYGGSSLVRAERDGVDAGAPPPPGCAGPPDALPPLCGPCGARWPEADGGTACERLTNPCGGCNPGVQAPGSSCGSGHYYVCAGPDEVSCSAGDPTNLNACGGRNGPLAHAPGERCGDALDCRYVCRGTAAVVCECPESRDAGP